MGTYASVQESKSSGGDEKLLHVGMLDVMTMSERSSADVSEEDKAFGSKGIESIREPTLGKRQVWLTYSITMTVEPSGVVTLPPYSGNCADGKSSLSAFDAIQKITPYSASFRQPAETRLSDMS